MSVFTFLNIFIFIQGTSEAPGQFQKNPNLTPEQQQQQQQRAMRRAQSKKLHNATTCLVCMKEFNNPKVSKEIYFLNHF